MKVTAILVFCIITTLSEAHDSNEKRTIEIYEILQNQRTKDIQVNPVKLRYDLESTEPKVETLSKLLLPQKPKRVNGKSRDFSRKPKVDVNSRDFVKKLRDLKTRQAQKETQDEPLIVILASDSLITPEGSLTSSESDVGYFDETGTRNFLKSGAEEIYHIVPPKENILSKGRRYTPGNNFSSQQRVKTVTSIPNQYFAYDENMN